MNLIEQTGKGQPGSSFKPFIYSAALNKGYTPPQSLMIYLKVFKKTQLAAHGDQKIWKILWTNKTQVRSSKITKHDIN